MYKITWDRETGGVLLHTRNVEGTLGVSPRPVFYEELDLLGLDKQGWTYPHCKEPLMWAVNKQYWYRGQHLFDAKGANIYTAPTLEFQTGVEPQTLVPVDVRTMLKRTGDLMFVMENEAIEFIRDIYTEYARVNNTYDKADANRLDFEAMAAKAEKATKQKMAVVKQDCDSFDIMPLDAAKAEGKRALLSTKIDRFIASFSGGKDSQVVLDLCTRAIPSTAFEVIYSDTGYELPPSLALYEEVQRQYNDRFPKLRFHLARNHESVLNYWDKIGTPSDTHRWCCSVMKTAPLYRMFKVDGNKQAHVLAFDGVRAEESIKRDSYARIGKGKHTFVYNAHPILKWNAIEIFLYLLRYDLPINPAYRIGKARVGCLICPFSTSWDDMIVNREYREEVQPFIGKIRTYSGQVGIADIDGYLNERRWKLKSLGDKNQTQARVAMQSEVGALCFKAEIKDASQRLQSWLPALCKYSIHETANGYRGELLFKKNVYPFTIVQKGDITKFEVTEKPDADLTFLLRRLVYKTAYCINCEVCEVDCPTGALSIIPNVNIDKTKCIHCHKCFNTHDRGCIAADCIRMITDTERKLNAKVQAYKKFGLRDEWVEEFFIHPNDFWGKGNNSLGSAQEDSAKPWLRDAEITDLKNNITPFGKTLQAIYQNNPLLFWEIALINLSYNSFIVNWFCVNIKSGQTYSSKLIREEFANQGYAGNLTTIENAGVALVDLMRKSPLGEDMCQGIDHGREGVERAVYDDLSAEAVAYSLYKYAQFHEISMFRVSDLYRPEEEHGPYAEFRITRNELLKKLRLLTTDSNRVLIAELNMGLDHITLREDLTAEKVLEILAL